MAIFAVKVKCTELSFSIEKLDRTFKYPYDGSLNIKISIIWKGAKAY